MSDRRPTSARLPPVIILAGGFGTRIRHLLPGRPKPMAPVAGRPFVEWVIRFFVRHGAQQFVLSTGYLAETIAEHFRTQPVPGADVSCRPETEPLGTAGGFLNCLPAAPAEADRWIVANGDSLLFADPAPLVRATELRRAEAALLGLALDDAGRYGTLDFDAEGRLTAFREKRPGAGVINAGVYSFTRSAVQEFAASRPLSFETDVFPALAMGGRAVVIPTRAPFLDIGTPDSLAEAEQFIMRNQSEFFL